MNIHMNLSMQMKQNFTLTLISAGLALTLGACSGGGGGGSGGGGVVGGADSAGLSNAQKEIITTATTGRDGSWSRVDVLNGGQPPINSQDPTDPGNLAPNPALRDLMTALSKKQTDLNANLTDNNLDGIADTGTIGGGLDPYFTGLNQSESTSKRIYLANNIYDLFQTTTGRTITGRPNLLSTDGGPPPFTGGDKDGDGITDGGPGLFSNVPNSIMPTLPPLPNAMGTPTGSGSGRGPGIGDDQHQFIQIDFPYKLNRDSLFNFLDAGNSFLGDQLAPGNVIIEARWVSRVDENDTVNVVDHTFEHLHVPGVAVIGGVSAVPLQQGFSTLTTVDPDISNIPDGAKAKLLDPSVFTYIANEAPASISVSNPVGSPLGWILPDGTLILPDPTDLSGLGGRVFGANIVIPSSVNDFATDGDNDAARIGFVAFSINRMRKGNGTVNDPYFHSFPISQAAVGADPLSIVGTFNRGPAIEVDPISSLPAIDVLDSSKDYLGSVDQNPTSDTINIVSTKAHFRVDFDKEVVPNSVGFSKRHTIHAVLGKGVVFPFSGNTRPITSPSTNFTLGVFGAPLGTSIYLAVNQPVQIAVNNPFIKNANTDASLTDGGDPIPSLNPNPALENGLFPQAHNTLATLPRGVIPCDIYPVNQNNLQAYIVEPLVDLPPNTVVTIGVCMGGLGMSNLALPATVVSSPTNFGNYTRSGTLFTPWQGLTAVGLGDATVTQKQITLANQTVIKVNAGPMGFQGLLFFGGTAVVLDTLIDGDPANDATMGGWNVSRTFKVGLDQERGYVNAPVAPQAIVVGFGNEGLGVIDLNGEGFNTNAPLGGLSNFGLANKLVTSRYLPPFITGVSSILNWDSSSSLAGGANARAYGVLGRYTSGGCICNQVSYESEFATGIGIPLGPIAQKRVPGVNEGSSGYETMVRDSQGSQFLTDPNDIGIVRDLVMGKFLDSVYFDVENPFLKNNHVTFVTPAQTGVSSNLISDPPVPNPPPLRLPEGLPLTAVIFDQAKLLADPVLISSSEVFGRDYLMRFDDGTGQSPFTWPGNVFLNLNPTSNTSNPNLFDVPLLPNAGFPSPFAGEFNFPTKFLQTGPMPKTTTAGTVVLTALNTIAIGSGFPGGLQAPNYQSRQQIGNFLFVSDGVNKQVHAVNTNTMEVLQSIDLPDPYGLGLAPEGDLLYVSNEGANSLSVVVANPTSASFMTEVARVTVGEGPRAVSVSPDNEDVFVLNRLGNTVSIVDAGTNTVRRTLTQSGLNRPNDVCIGMREFGGGPAFQSGTYHGFISNGGGNNVLIYEGGPSGVAGIGFDNILGSIAPNKPVVVGQPTLRSMKNPTGIVYDPNTPLDGFAHTIGAFVAHQDAEQGNAMVSRISYSADSSPGQATFNAGNISPGFGEKVFTIVQQYISSSSGKALDVALPDYNRELYLTSNFNSHFNLLNAGGVTYTIGGQDIARNSKYPLASNILPAFNNGPRWDPDRLYLSVGGGTIDVFDIDSSIKLKTIPTSANATVMASYFSQ
jgi:YVTN family beta-propeller protein